MDYIPRSHGTALFRENAVCGFSARGESARSNSFRCKLLLPLRFTHTRRAVLSILMPADLHNIILFLAVFRQTVMLPCQMRFHAVQPAHSEKMAASIIITPRPSPRIFVDIIMLCRNRGNRNIFLSHLGESQSHPTSGSIRSRISRSKSSLTARTRPVSPWFSISPQSQLEIIFLRSAMDSSSSTISILLMKQSLPLIFS